MSISDGETLHRIAADAAQECANADIYPFSTGWEAARAGGKWFALFTTLQGEQLVVVKAEPDDGYALRQSYPSITPGYHMNKKHWITLHPGPDITEQLVREVVTDSYRLVTAPKSRAKPSTSMYPTTTDLP